MTFSEMAAIFDEIEQESSRTKMTIMLADLCRQITPVEAAYVSYFSLGELNPVYIGTQFNIADKTMIRVVAALLHESQVDVEKRKKKVGDLGLVVAEGLWRRAGGDQLSIKDVHAALKDLHSISGTGAQEKKEELLLALLKQLEAQSAKYVVRIILGKLRLGFSDMTLLDAFSWMYVGDKSLRDALEIAYNVSADIGLIIKTLKEEGLRGIESMAIEPGIPVRPAAAERMPDAKSIIKKLGSCVAQSKLDGFRVQVHLFHRGKTAHVHFYSRNLQDMSDMFPELTKSVQSLEVKEFVAEGEAIAYDQETGTFLPFQETVKRKRKYDIEEVAKDFPLKLYFFDLLYLNGESLLDEPHEERRKKLKRLVPASVERKGVIHVIDEEKVSTAQELEELFHSNITQGLEGLVVKKVDAPYQAGKRNFNWIKLKREEAGELEDTIDCVILGYYAGHGKRASFGIGAFLVGVRNPKNDDFETIAKIGTGLTDAGWKELKKLCDDNAVGHKPKDVVCAKELQPDVWVAPEIVCAIRADEITLSPLHSAGATEEHLGYALRFPRFMGYRADKSPGDATTIKEVASLYAMQFSNKEKRSKAKTKNR